MSAPRKEVPPEDKAVLNVLLNCEETKSSETKQETLPTTPVAIMRKIKENLSIPSCVQTLYYQLAKDVIKWLKKIYELFQPVLLRSSIHHACVIESMISDAQFDGTLEALSEWLFIPWKDKRMLMNKNFFHLEGGLDMLIKIYGIVTSKKWGRLGLGIEEDLHMCLERNCSTAIYNYGETFPLRRQIVQLGGLEMCARALLKIPLHKHISYLRGMKCVTLYYALLSLCSLSELPECQMPLAMRKNVIDQALAMAFPEGVYRSVMAEAALKMILCLTQSPETHGLIARRELVEKILKIIILCEDYQESSISLKYYIGIAFSQIGLGSPHLLFDSIPPHLLQQIIDLMSNILGATSPAEICQYEEKEKSVWWRFSPYLQYLYKPSPVKESKEGDIYHICCNILLHRLESALGREVHLEILVKEGLLDYIMCLPAVLPGECQPRARSLVNELGKHRQLQPPRLFTLAKARIAKTFCGLQPVMEIKYIGEFLQSLNKRASTRGHLQTEFFYASITFDER